MLRRPILSIRRPQSMQVTAMVIPRMEKNKGVMLLSAQIIENAYGSGA